MDSAVAITPIRLQHVIETNDVTKTHLFHSGGGPISTPVRGAEADGSIITTVACATKHTHEYKTHTWV